MDIKGVAHRAGIAGLAALLVVGASMAGQALAGKPVALADGTGTVAGHVRLQARASFAGITITVGGQTATTGADGGFIMLGAPAGTYDITATYPGFVPARRSAASIPAGGSVLLDDVVLLAGDINGDNEVGLVDLVLLGRDYGQQPPSNPTIDLNGDGRVNLFDLVLLGANYNVIGPLPWSSLPTPTVPPTATPTRTPTVSDTPTATWTPEVTDTETPAPTATDTVVPSPTPTNDLKIISLQFSGTDEFVGIANYGPNPQSMTGWRIRSEASDMEYVFQASFTLGVNSYVKVHSGPTATSNPPLHLLWTISAVWRDLGDEAQLIGPPGLVDSWAYGDWVAP